MRGCGLRAHSSLAMLLKTWPIVQASLAAATLCLQASAAVGVVAGNLADWLQKARGWKAVRVRALTQSLATLGDCPPRQLTVRSSDLLQISACTPCPVVGHGRGTASLESRNGACRAGFEPAAAAPLQDAHAHEPGGGLPGRLHGLAGLLLCWLSRIRAGEALAYTPAPSCCIRLHAPLSYAQSGVPFLQHLAGCGLRWPLGI